MSLWFSYFLRVGSDPNSVVRTIFDEFPVNRGVALDLGAGNMRDAKFILAQGFRKVVAIDVDPASPDFLVQGIELHRIPIEAFNFASESFDLIISYNTLFYLSQKEVEKIFVRACRGLKPGGVFGCNLVGKKDTMVSESRSRFSRTDVEKMVQPFSWCSLNQIKHEAQSSKGNVALLHQWSVIVGK